MTQVLIYHNPRCSKSRAALALLRERGIEPEIVEYLKTPPNVARLGWLLDRLGMAPRALMRTREAAFRENGLAEPGLDRAALIGAMVDNPILIERPIVVAGGRAALGRPPKTVLDIL